MLATTKAANAQHYAATQGELASRVRDDNSLLRARGQLPPPDPLDSVELDDIPAGYIAAMSPPEEGIGDIVPISVYTVLVNSDTDDEDDKIIDHDKQKEEAEKKK